MITYRAVVHKCAKDHYPRRALELYAETQQKMQQERIGRRAVFQGMPSHPLLARPDVRAASRTAPRTERAECIEPEGRRNPG